MILRRRTLVTMLLLFCGGLFFMFGTGKQDVQVRSAPRFFLSWTAGVWTNRPMLAVMSIFVAHPDADVRIYTNDANVSNVLAPLQNLGLNIRAVPYDFVSVLRGTPAAQFAAKTAMYENHRYWYSHKTDFLRMALLYKYGGCWMDTDMWLLKPIDFFRNSLPIESARAEDFSPYLCGAIMCFDQGHRALRLALKQGASNYNPDHWTTVGPALLSWLFQQFKQQSRAFEISPKDAESMSAEKIIFERHQSWKDSIFAWPSHVMFPFHYDEIQLAFAKKAPAGWLKKTAAMHLWNSLSSGQRMVRGSMIDEASNLIFTSWVRRYGIDVAAKLLWINFDGDSHLALKKGS